MNFRADDFSAPLLPGTTLLEASAGTGKTYALSALYLRLLLECGLTVGQILVTTFTNAATAELRGRIRKLLREAHDVCAGGDTEDALLFALRARWQDDLATARRRLHDALLEFDEAAIFTIHSFCQRVLADRTFESAQLAGQTLVTDERNLIADVTVDYWRQRFYDCTDCLSAAIAASELSPGRLVNLLKLRLEQPAARILPEHAEGSFAELCREITARFDECRACWEQEETELRRVFSLGANAWAKRKHQEADEVAARLDAIARCFRQPAGDAEGHAAFAFFAQSTVEKNTRVRNLTPPLRFFRACEALHESGGRLATQVQLDFLAWSQPRLAARKAQLGVHSYGDWLTRLQESLRGAGGAEMMAAVRSRYRAALVDEFQDTDPVQEEIFTRLFGDGAAWLFLIGDPKQAIYSFRGADVFAYLRTADRVPEERRFTLGTNYRSAEALVRGTNALFQGHPETFVLPQLEFHPVNASGKREEGRFSGDAHGAPLRVWQWTGDGSQLIGETQGKIIEATAAEIARLLTGAARLGARPIQPKDIAVLIARHDDARPLQEALARRGVPSVMFKTGSVFASREARELHALLAAVARPSEEGLVRHALVTSIFGLDFTVLDGLPEAERWTLHFVEWHAVWLKHGFSAMFGQVLQTAQTAPRLLALVDGERRLTNLLHLAELLQRAALAEGLAPRAQVKWLARQIAEAAPGNEEHEVRLERDDEAVRIATIHSAKGLEYEIVFCPLLIRDPKLRDKVLRFHDPASGELLLDLQADPAHEEAARREVIADEVRKLYVALTRAHQRCDFVWGEYKGSGPSALGWLIHPEPEQRTAALEALVARAEGAIALHPLPPAESPIYRPDVSGATELQARPFRGKIALDYSVSSFSSLAEAHNPELPDYDPPTPAEVEAEAEGFHAFPGGKRCGTFVHEIFEELDFSRPGEIDELVRRKLAQHSYAVAAWSEPVSAMIRRTLTLPLADGFQLGQIALAARLAEVEFFLPAGRLEARALSRLLAEEELDLDFAPRQGWVKGFIDAIVEHDGRYYFFDWKTNRLGNQNSAYSQPALKAAMRAHRYGLQLHLYTLAMHRYLAQRVPGYRYEEHFGGVYYLFLRGLDPAQPELGVVHRRPSEETVSALEKWLQP